MIEPLSETEYQYRAEPVFNSVFAEANPFGEPFRPSIQPRLLLYSIQWHLHEPWLEPVTRAIQAFGEKGFYVTALSRPVQEKPGEVYHWYVPLDQANQYGSRVFSQENAIYSVLGRWGMIFSDEDHALVGGPRLLISSIQNAVPDVERRVQQFLDVWKYYFETNHVDLHWLPRMLTHVYGLEKARKLLLEAQLEWLLQDR